MLDGIEALMALDKYGTVSEAAVRLRLTQSAISKRIQALQHLCKLKLVEPEGRRLKLTPAAYQFLAKARPLLLELKGLTEGTNWASSPVSRFSLGLSDSIASSFGPYIIHETLKSFKNIKLEIHVHRSMMLIENIYLGKYQMGICTTEENKKDLIYFPLVEEPLVLLNAQGKTKTAKDLPLITIEENSGTWKHAGLLLKREYPHLFFHSVIHVESFMAVFQMAKIGLGNGVIPLGLAKELRINKTGFKNLKITRPVSLVTRKTMAHLDFFEPVYQKMKKNIQTYFGGL